MKAVCFICALGVSLVFSTLAVNAQNSWTNRYNGPGNNADQANAIAVDGNGNVFVTGYSWSGSSYDYATIKYSNAGVSLWTNRYNGPGNNEDRSSAITADNDGNVFVTGYSPGSGSGQDYATIKYSNAGVPLWTNRYNGPGNSTDQATGIAVGGGGDVFVTGYSYSSSDSSSADYATIKYSSDGIALWTNRYNGPGNDVDQATAIALGVSGNVFVTGYSYSGSGSSSSDYATIMYSSEGIALWTNRYNGPNDRIDQARAIAVHGNGNVFVTGSSRGSGSVYFFATIKYDGSGCPPIALNPTSLPVGTNGSTYTVSFSASGGAAPYTFTVTSGALPAGLTLGEGGLLTGIPIDEATLINFTVTATDDIGCTGSRDYALALAQKNWTSWTNRYNGPLNRGDIPSAIALDGNGDVFVTGNSPGGIGYSSYATIKYFNGGVALWTNRYNDDAWGDDVPNAMAVDANGDVFVTGNSYSNSYDYATIKYSNDGVMLWENRHDNAGGFDYATGIAVDGNGNSFVTGVSTGTNGFANPDYVTIKYSSAGVPLWTNRYNGPGNGCTIALDGNGNVFVTGVGYKTVKYSNDGTLLWTRSVAGTANAIKVDGNGNVFVTGVLAGDYVTVKYSSDGIQQWMNYYFGPGDILPGDSGNVAYGLAVDANGNVFVTGKSIALGGGSDYATIKYSNSGLPLWTNRFKGPGPGTAPPEQLPYSGGIAVDGNGNAFVTGFSGESNNELDWVIVKYGVGSAFLQPAVFENPQLSTGTFSFTLTGEPNVQFVIQSSTNLVNWEVIRQVTIPATGSTNIVEALAPTTGQKYYRAQRQ